MMDEKKGFAAAGTAWSVRVSGLVGARLRRRSVRRTNAGADCGTSGRSRNRIDDEKEQPDRRTVRLLFSLCVQEQRLELAALQGGLQRRAELVHIRYQGAWFSLWIILPEGNEIIVLTRQETANVFGVTGQGVVACDSQKWGRPLRRCAFGCQGNGGICHAAGKLCQRVACAGAMTSASSSFFGPDRLGVADAADGRTARGRF